MRGRILEYRNKYYILGGILFMRNVLLLFVFILVLFGCVSKEEQINTIRQEALKLLEQNNYNEAIAKYEEIITISNDSSYKIELIDIKIKKLKVQADAYLQNGKLDEAIDLYIKMLEIKEEDSLRKELDEIKYEKESVDKVKEFRNELYEIQKNRLRSGIEVKPTDMEYIIEDLRIVFEGFGKIDDNRNTAISSYVKQVKGSLAYELMKIDLESELFDGSGLSEGLGKLDKGMNTLNTIIVAFTRNSLNENIEKILAMSLPSVYDK
jgi:tetratricopeptide (TPR) repeat protein